MYTSKTQIYVYQGAKVLGIMEEAKSLYIRIGSLFCSPTSCNNRTVFASLDVTGACWDKFVPVGYVVLHFVTELTRSITICFTSICWTYGLDLYYSTTGKYVYIHTYIHICLLLLISNRKETSCLPLLNAGFEPIRVSDTKSSAD